MHGFGYFAHCGPTLTLLTHRYHKNTGSVMSLESCLQLTAEILVKWVIFTDVTLEFCMDLATSYATSLRHSLMSVLGDICIWWSFPLFFAFINSCYSPMWGAVKWLIVWGVTAPWEIMLCSWVFWFAELQCCDAGLNDLPFSLSNSTHSMISSFFVAPRGFYSKVYSKGIMKY
jgi:hypothetical protein